MTELCPDCGGRLRKRAPNKKRNIARRQIESVFDRYVCVGCKATFPIAAIEENPEISAYTDWK